MGVENRNLGSAEQKEPMRLSVLTTAVGNYAIGSCPRPMQITDGYATVQTLLDDTAPTGQLKISRLISGAGQTLITVSGALTHVAHASIGVQQLSLPAAGSSLLNLIKNDELVWVASGATATASADTLAVTVVLKNVQDVKAWY